MITRVNDGVKCGGHRPRTGGPRLRLRLNPRVCRVAALPAPNDRERTQWHFEHYVWHLPAAGEIVLFNRSGYNHPGAERVMGLCTDEQYEAFFRSAPRPGSSHPAALGHTAHQVPVLDAVPQSIVVPEVYREAPSIEVMKWPPVTLLLVVAATWMASAAWRQHVSDEDGRLLAQRVKPGDMRMISSETCPFCLAARRWMTQQGIPFQECFIERDEQCLADYQALGGLGTPTFVVRGERVVGFDRARLLEIVK